MTLKIKKLHYITLNIYILIKMIKVFLIVNSSGKIRIRRFYDEVECINTL